MFAKGKARKQKKQPWWRKKEAKEEISCLVKTIVTCLRKQRGADNSRRNVSRGSHRNGTQSFLWQVNLLQEPNVFRNSLSSGSCLLLKLPQKASVKHCEAWSHSKCNQLDKAVSILPWPLVLTRGNSKLCAGQTPGCLLHCKAPWIGCSSTGQVV